MNADTLRTTGIALMVGGAIAASPADEVALAVATAGGSAPFSPVQGTATLAGGLLSMGLGAALLLAAAKAKP